MRVQFGGRYWRGKWQEGQGHMRSLGTGVSSGEPGGGQEPLPGDQGSSGGEQVGKEDGCIWFHTADLGFALENQRYMSGPGVGISRLALGIKASLEIGELCAWK